MRAIVHTWAAPFHGEYAHLVEAALWMGGVGIALYLVVRHWDWLKQDTFGED